jgi:hypothetical protein
VQAWAKSIRATLAKSQDGWLAPTPIVVVLTNVTVVTNKTKLTNMVAATENSPALTNITNRIAFKTNSTIATNFVVQADGSLLFGSKPDGNPISLKLSEGSIATLRMELIPHEKHGGTVFRGSKGAANVQLSASLKRAGEKKETKLTFYHADADAKEARYANGDEIIGIKDMWKVSRGHAKEKQTGVWLLDPPVPVKDGDTLVLTMKTNSIGCSRWRFRISNLRSSILNPQLPGWPEPHQTQMPSENTKNFTARFLNAATGNRRRSLPSRGSRTPRACCRAATGKPRTAIWLSHCHRIFSRNRSTKERTDSPGSISRSGSCRPTIR